ncbi:MAG: 16S rRNA (guanine(527)-N(7))-methyltransferase RsmG [Mesorhizobium sp.]|nr:16S rRNA (guanine(527)-N(7))-methyltransferase RsmG [Mesorhizobium sp.]
MSDEKYDQLRSVAGPVSRETYERLLTFESEFRRWSQRINLAAPSTIDTLWRRHIIDSAQLLAIESGPATWLDLGSGGGFPGAVLAILFAGQPGASVTLVESNRKKAAFLQSVLGQMRVPVAVLPVRIEDAPAAISQADIVTARALAPLNDLLRLSEPWLTRGARGLFHKGREYRTEVEKCHDAWQFDLVEHPSLIDGDGAILEITNLSPR